MVRSRKMSGRNSLSGTVPVSRKAMSFSQSGRTRLASMSVLAMSVLAMSVLAMSGTARPGRLEVLADDCHGLVQRAGRAELDEFGPGEQQRQVPGHAVVGVAGRVDLVVIGVPEDDLAGQHHAPMRALAPVIRQAPEKRRRVRVGLVRLERHGVFVKLDVTALDLGLVEGYRGVGFARSGHCFSFHRRVAVTPMA